MLEATELASVKLSAQGERAGLRPCSQSFEIAIVSDSTV